MQTLNLPELPLPVLLVRRARKSIGIRIASGRVEVVAPPRVQLAEIERLLRLKRAWIVRHLERQQQTLAALSAFPTQLLLAGQPLPVIHCPALPAAVRQSAAGLEVGGPDHQLKTQLAAYLQTEARRLFPSRFALLAQQAARPPVRMLLSGARTRWGSCTRQGVIRLNWRLVQAPPAVLDYVIAHELAHLRHMNHSPEFWRETARLFPEWQPARAWLKTHGERLFVFG